MKEGISFNVHDAEVGLYRSKGTTWLEIDQPGRNLRANVFLAPEQLDALEMAINELRAEEERLQALVESNGHAEPF